MSPNEDQLRAALREGEGQRPDPDAVIGRVLQLRHQRRRRFTAVAAAAAVVAVIGGGTALLVNLGSSSESAGSAALNEQRGLRHRNTAPSASRPSAPAATDPSTRAGFGADARPCPANLPGIALPGGGGIGQFGSDQPLFASPVRTLTVCVYTSPGKAVTGAVRLSGTAATSLVASLDNAPSKLEQPCTRVSVSPQSLAIVAVDTRGNRERTVTVQLTCPYLATNGTAARYLDPQFAQSLRVSGGTDPGGVVELTDPPGHPIGTPVK